MNETLAQKKKRQELDALVDILNPELKEEFDYVPLGSVTKIAERLLEKGFISVCVNKFTF